MATGKIKTLKLKRTADEENVEADQGSEESMTEASPSSSTAFAATPSSGSSYTLDAILALIAVLLFSGLILLQVLELNEYSRPPSAWASSQR